MRKKKLMYKRLLDTGTEDARRHYNEVNVEARIVVRRNKNDVWIQLGIELEKYALGDQRRFWASVNGSKEARDRMQQICGSDGRVLVGVEIRDQWKEHFEELYGLQTDQVIRHCTWRPHWKVARDSEGGGENPKERENVDEEEGGRYVLYHVGDAESWR